MLCGENILSVLMAFPDILSVFIPEIAQTVGFDQKNPAHPYDLWEHTARSVDATQPDSLIRLTLLFHDLGKPRAFLGADILSLGVETGSVVGGILNALLNGVMEGRIENEREALLAVARGLQSPV